ncbi:MAG TPA: hypothetical protein VFC44_08350 [Candidatus Saccharimonadales bacterium]|nr:hypothetical protein [Candidatus Saccharimonadales bacterium]
MPPHPQSKESNKAKIQHRAIRSYRRNKRLHLISEGKPHPPKRALSLVSASRHEIDFLGFSMGVRQYSSIVVRRFRAKAELAFRTPWRFAHTAVAEEPAGFGLRARQRRFPAASVICIALKNFALHPVSICREFRAQTGGEFFEAGGDRASGGTDSHFV